MRPNQKLEYIGDVICKFVISSEFIETLQIREIENILCNSNMGRVYSDYLNGKLPAPLHGVHQMSNGVFNYSLYYAREFEVQVARIFYKDGFDAAKQFIKETLIKDFNNQTADGCTAKDNVA